MTNFLKTFTLLFAFVASTTVFAQNSIAPEELNVILGNWTGSLTYINYSDGTPFTMPAELEINAGKNKYEFDLFTSYPNEPKANSKGAIKLSKDGTKINKEPIKSIEKLANQELLIITEYQGKDDRKNALIRNNYTIGKSTLIIKKEIKFESSKNWLTRNEYRYIR